MINLATVLIISTLMYFFFYIVGEGFLRTLKQEFHCYFAPIIGYAVFSYIFFILLHITTDFYVLLAVSLSLLGGGILLRKKQKLHFPKLPYLTLFLSFLISLNLLYSLYPKSFAGNLVWSAPILDHIKTAFTTSIAQSGIPVENPYCAFPDKTYYYFLYYVPLAVIKIVFNITAYEAELSGEVLSCLLGIPLMVGCLCLLKERECSWKEIIICFLFILMTKTYDFEGHGIDSVLRTILWTPNTFLATSLLIFSLFGLHKIKNSICLPALLLSVAFGMSPYVFLVAFLGIGLFFLYDFCFTFEKKQLFIRVCKFAALTLLFSLPFFLIQIKSTQSHQFPIALEIYDFTLYLKDPLWKFLGFWSLFLLSQIPIIFLINLAFLNPTTLKKYTIFYFSIFASLLIFCFLKSTIGNNDLGWRASFTTVELLTIFAVYYFGQIKKRFWKILIICGCIGFISIPYLDKETGSCAFSLSSETISAIQQHVQEKDRFLNNINADGLMAPWKGNVGFAILSERKSCFMSPEAARVYCHNSMRDYENLALRIFSGEISKDDIKVAKELKCNKFIFQNTDLNYDKDDLLSSFGLQKIYENDQIKIWE